jgi:hypothetical protein
MTAAGRSGGAKLGDAAGLAAGTKLKSRLLTEAKAAVAPLAGLFAGAAAFSFFKGSFDEAREAATVSRQTAAALKATGGEANVTASEIEKLSASLSKQVGIDDEAIAGMQNILLTFRSVANEAGAGNDIFNQATEAILNVSTALGTDLNSSALQVGKALNDPIKGMAALSRSGIQFTEDQKAQAKAMVESGDLMGAQKIILAELSAQFDGAADAGHDATDDLKVAFGNLQESVGTALLPALTGAANVTTNQLIPALGGIGGVVSDAASAFGKLPGPVQVAAGAFVALRTASAIGLTAAVGDAARSGVSRMSSVMDTLRQRVDWAKAAYSNARTSVFEFGAAGGQVSGQVSRLSAGMQGIRAAAFGAAGALRSVALAAAPIAAITAAVTIWSKFKQGQEEAKARVEELTASLDEQTGRITEGTREIQIRALLDSDAIDLTKKLGLSIEDVTQAALGNRGALASVNAELAELAEVRNPEGITRTTQDAQALIDMLNGTTSELAKSRDAWIVEAEVRKAAAEVTETVAVPAMRNYAGEIDNAQSKLKKLIDREQERRDALMGDRRDAIALQESLKAAREESRKGDGGLDITKGEGRANMSALLDIADQFNDSTNKVRNQNFIPVREEFVRLADKMGKTKEQAEKMADQLLRVPKSAPLRFQTEGYRRTMAEIAAIKAAAESAALLVIVPGTGNPGPSPKFPDQDPSGNRNPDFRERPGNNVNYYGPVTYTDDEQGRRDARRRRQRAGSDGVRR